MLLCTLPRQEQKDIFSEIEGMKHISAQAVEKDWWICIVLRALFSTVFAENMIFKGGTSLSKGWYLIERFSEDIDIAIDRTSLGWGGKLTKSQIGDKLRRAACHFVRTQLKDAVEQSLQTLKVPHSLFSVSAHHSSVSTVDPETITIDYQSVYSGSSSYLPSKVIVEAGARSMSEPFEYRSICSFVSESFTERAFADSSFSVPAASPERTFLEKAFLLHEEFQKPPGKIRSSRMSRHLYDLERMMDTTIAGHALSDKNLYHNVVEHRRNFIGLKDFDYDTLYPPFLDLVPPDSVVSAWERDYRAMRENMIYGKSLDFQALLERIAELNKRFNES